MKRFFDYALCSVGGVGYIPFASGTFGSLVALLLAWYFGISGYYAFLTAIVLYAISVPCIKNVMKKTEHDPSLIVIDEVVGQMIAYAFLPSDAKTVGYYIVGFMFFRFFDLNRCQSRIFQVISTCAHAAYQCNCCKKQFFSEKRLFHRFTVSLVVILIRLLSLSVPADKSSDIRPCT